MERLFSWIESELVGESLALYFSRPRPEMVAGNEAIVFEARVHLQLEAECVPALHVYGVCPDPCGIVMDRSPRRAILTTAHSPTEQKSVFDDYIEILVRLHGLD